MKVSVCIPCYCAERLLRPLIEEIKKEFEKRPEYDYQIVLVDDGSPDRTYETIKELCNQDKKIVGVALSRNCGQNIASRAALPYVQGDCAVFMDDDGQHPVYAIFDLVKKIEEGYDVAVAKLEHKQHNLFKRITSDLNGWMSEWAGVKPKGIYFSGFYAWSRFAIDALLQYGSPFFSSVGYLTNVTTRFVNIQVEHQKRAEGHSGYTLKKLFSLWATNLTSFSMRPLRTAFFLGSVLAFAGFMFGFYLVLRRFIVQSIVPGYTTIMAFLLLIGGVILIFLGIIGEYVGRIYMTVSDLPQYLVREDINANLSKL